jgi:hypothetical protein
MDLSDLNTEYNSAAMCLLSVGGIVIFKKLVQSAQKLYNCVLKYSTHGVVNTLRLFRCRLDHVLTSCLSTNRHLQHSFSKINRNTKKWLVYSFNWINVMCECILTVPDAF